MDSFLTGQRNAASPDSVTEQVMVDARRAFSTLPHDTLEGVVRGAVSDLWSDSVKVTSFIRVLAMRSVRESLEQQTQGTEPVTET